MRCRASMWAAALCVCLVSLLSAIFALECTTYSLQNECTGLLGPQIALSSFSSQAELFSRISLDISSVRMFSSLTNGTACRRAYIWYLCNTAFPTCDPIANCTSSPSLSSCVEVNELCSESAVIVTLDCAEMEKERKKEDESLSRSMRRSDCTEGGLHLPDSVTATPIAVETCLYTSRSAAPCCEEPFQLSDSTSECVSECPWGIFSREQEQLLADIAYIFTWAGTILCFLSLFPTLFIDGMLEFPKYLTPLCSLMGVCVAQCLIASLYYGGGAAYVCGTSRDEGHLVATYTAFFHSSRCTAQLVLSSFFSSSLSYWYFILILCLVSLFLTDCLPFVAPLNRALSSERPRKKVEIAFHVGWLLVVGWTFLVYYLMIDPEGNVTAMPGVYACSGYTLLSVSLSLIFFLFSALLTFLALVTVGRRSWQFLLAQWRSAAFAIYFLFVSIFSFVPVFILNSASNPLAAENILSMQADWTKCVVENANVFPLPCTRPLLYPYWFMVFYYALLYSWSGFITTVTYLSNPFILHWWYYLIFQRVVVRNPAILLNEIETIS